MGHNVRISSARLACLRSTARTGPIPDALFVARNSTYSAKTQPQSLQPPSPPPGTPPVQPTHLPARPTPETVTITSTSEEDDDSDSDYTED